MIPEDAWPAGDLLAWDDDETRLHYDFTVDPPATTPYSDEENAAADERSAVVEEGTNRGTLTDQALSSLTANRTFLAAASPTNAQVVAQVKALTRQMNGVIRLLVGQLDGTD